MFEVFAFLFEHFQDLDYIPSIGYISEKLDEAGFDHEEINQVVDCLDALFISSVPKKLPSLRPSDNRICHRVFSTEENHLLKPEVRGYFSFLYHERALKSNDMELLIHASMLLGEKEGPIELDLAKVLTLMLAWATEAELQILIGDDLLSTLRDPEARH